MRTSPSQFELMITYMEQHGDLCKPATTTLGRIATMQRWHELTQRLNADGSGDSKTIEKWKKVWSDFKNNTKRKAARLHRAAGGKGGPVVTSKLSELEMRALKIAGVQAATDLAMRALKIAGVQAATGLALDEAGLPDERHEANNIEQTSPSPAPVPEDIESPEPERLILSPSPTRTPTPSPTVDEGCLLPLEITINIPPEVPPVQSLRRPAHNGHTPRDGTRIMRGRSRRYFRPTPTEQASMLFANSEKWRRFRQNAHKELVELKKEKNRIRKLELETQKGWQDVCNRAVTLLEKLVNKYCKD